jgi:hypothetical protein
MVRIAAAKAQPGYRLWLRFTDGAEGVVDLAHLVGRGIFSAWDDPAAFARVEVDPATGTVVWPALGIDLDPDVLYSKVTGAALPGTDAA